MTGRKSLESALSEEEINEELNEAEKTHAVKTQVRQREEIERIADQIRQLEAQGKSDEELTRILAQRGIQPRIIFGALQAHAIEHPQHEHVQENIERTLEDMTDTPVEEDREQRQWLTSYDPNKANGSAIYDIAARMQQGGNPYSVLSSQHAVDAIYELEQQVAARGGAMTPNEYSAMQELHEGWSQSASTYARRGSAVVERVKEMSGFRVESMYKRTFDSDE